LVIEQHAEQRKPLYGIFTDIPPHYDLINTLITWNMDKRWRRLAARACLAASPRNFLDLCCGTGDLAIEVARLASPEVEITGLDYSQPMLDIAVEKARRLAGERKIRFFQGVAASMPFPDGFFDSLGISFAFRNLTYRNPLAGKHLSEILRVLKKGGRCVIAESSQPDCRVIRTLYHFYMRGYVSSLGTWLSGNKPAYRYLAESASRYYTPSEMKTLLTESGFTTVSYRPLFFGVAGIYTAIK